MICRLPGNILHEIAVQLLTSSRQSSKSWFAEIRSLCYTYNLPHPLLLLQQPPSKEQFRIQLRSNITDYWQSKLRAHSATLQENSLKYFKPQYMSLSQPHPMWASATTSYQVNKCVVVARMLSGRFRCGSLLQHFSPACSGICELCDQELEDLPHILLPRCPHLQQRRPDLLLFARDTLSQSAVASNIFDRIFATKDEYTTVQFLLDPSAVPEIIAANQNDPTVLPLLFRVSTTWCYSLNRTRLKLLGRWT